MAHDCVRTGRNNGLIRGDIDRRRRERVLAIYEENEVQPSRDKHVAGYHPGERDRRPAITMVERGDNEERNETRRRPQHYELLDHSLFGGRPTTHAAFEQDRILSYEIARSERRRAKEYGQICPCLPIANGPCGDKDQQPHRAGETGERDSRAL